jgi:NADPH2:quinone reductase
MSSAKQLFSNIKADGFLELSINDVDIPEPGLGFVLVRMEASPINPSDMWPMFGPAVLEQAELSADGSMLSAPVLRSYLPMIKPRLDQSLAIGNEGAGIVVKTGEGAEALMDKTVSVMGGQSYAQYCCVPMQMCLPHHDDVTPREAASSFVNPLTALGMVETMRMEGHTALVHTAAASNLGQMLNKICMADGVELVNVVRKQEQVDILQALGAKYIVNSSSETYKQDLYAAIAATGATIAFDATGGGELASDILSMMEAFLSKDARGLNTYGSEQMKQVYLYGGLDVSPTILNRSYGMCWGVAGWLLPHFIARVGLERAGQLQQRVAREIKTTFASEFTQELSLAESIEPKNVALYMAKQTGEKYLMNPNKNL